MNILINCSNIKVGGGIQVAHSFIYELNNLNIENYNYVVILSSILKQQIDPEKFSYRFTFYTYNIDSAPQNIFYRKNSFLDKLVNKHKIDKVFTVFGPAYWRPTVTHICGYAKPQYVYENSPFFRTICFKDKFFLKIKEFFHIYDFKYNSDILITENPDVSEKITKRLKKRVYTVTNNYNQVFDEPEEWDTLKLPSFEGSYILTISADYPHKNLRIIPQIIETLQKRNIHNYKFVVTLEKDSLSKNEIINNDIVYLGKVSIKQCPSLYLQSKYMFLPTLLECFSASYAEAMRMSKIIITSDLEFARGICKDAAIFFNPLNPADFVEKLLDIDQDSILQEELKQKGTERLHDFDTSKQRAEKYLQIISEF